MGILLNFRKGKSMFKVTYKQLRSDALKSALVKIATSSDYKNINCLKKVAALVKAVEEKLHTSQKDWVALADTLIQKDAEKGNYKFTEQKGPVWLEGVEAEKADKQIEDFLAKEVIIEAPKISITDIASVVLSPADIVNLSPVLAD